MTEEEKKVIEYFKKSFTSKTPPYWYDDTIENSEIKIKTLVNLIEKLKKENHDLKNKVWLYTDKYNDMVISNGKYLDKIIKLEKNSIPKDKIREKIKDLQKDYNNDVFIGYEKITGEAIKKLKELLEEE